MVDAYGKSGSGTAKEYASWARFSANAYVSDTHGARYVQNYANIYGQKAYSQFEEVGTMPTGSVLAKDSFKVNKNGTLTIGPLFLMSKMSTGFASGRGDWKYTMIMPDGSTFGETGGSGSANVEFCSECHAAADDQDYLFFVPDELRVSHN